MPPLAALLISLLVPSAPPRLDADGIPLPAEAVCRLGSARFRHALSVDEMTVTPDGRTLLTLDGLPTGGQFLCGWDAATGVPSFRVPVGQGYHRWLSVAADGVRVEEVTAEYRFCVTRYDPATGRRLGPPAVYPPRVNRWASLSPDGKFFAAHLADEVRRYSKDETDHVLTLHPTGGGLAVEVFREPNDFQATMSPDGRRLAVVSENEKSPRVRLFDTGTGKLVRELTADGESADPPVFTPDGKHIAAVVYGKDRQALVVWDVATGRRRELVADRGRGLVGPPLFSADGRRVVTRDWDRFEVAVRDAATGRVLNSLPLAPASTAISPTGDTLYATTEERAIVTRLDLKTGAAAVTDPPHWVDLLRFGPGGRVYGSIGRETKAIGWDIRTEAVVLRGHTFAARTPSTDRNRYEDHVLDISPDGRWVVVNEINFLVGALVATRAKSFRVCDAATGAVRATCTGHTEPVEKVKFAADGSRLYSKSKTERLTWDPVTGLRLDAPDAKTFDFETVISRDGRMSAIAHETEESVASDCAEVRLIERVTGKVRHTFRGHRGVSYGLAFSPDGRYLAVASSDAPVFVWDVRGELSKPAAPPDLAAAWADLASDDAAKAFRAVRLLAHFPKLAVPFLRAKLPPAKGPTADELAKLVADLDAAAFADREAADAALKKLGPLAASALREALKTTTSAEVRQRAERLLAALDAGKPGPEQLRAVRAVEAVGWMGTADARKLLAEWAGGAPGATLTTEAAAGR